MGFDMDMSEMLGVFLEEAQEQLQKLDDGILSLEKDPEDIEIIKEIFRAAHTLKGSSATIGLREIADLTHENLGEVEDDGGGISVAKVKAAALKGTVSEEMLSRMSDEDALQLIFAAGVSTAEKVTDISGCGVGMDVVRSKHSRERGMEAA